MAQLSNKEKLHSIEAMLLNQIEAKKNLKKLIYDVYTMKQMFDKDELAILERIVKTAKRF